MSKRAKNPPVEEHPPVRIKFGGWHEGDNHKPFRGWYYVCRCGHVGLGQLLRYDAVRRWQKHARRCEQISEGEAA